MSTPHLITTGCRPAFYHLRFSQHLWVIWPLGSFIKPHAFILIALAKPLTWSNHVAIATLPQEGADCPFEAACSHINRQFINLNLSKHLNEYLFMLYKKLLPLPLNTTTAVTVIACSTAGLRVRYCWALFSKKHVGSLREVIFFGLLSTSQYLN